MNVDRFSESAPVAVLDATDVVAAGTTTGDTIDTLGYRSLVAAVDIDWTAGAVDSIGFQESDDGTTWADADDSVNLYYPDAFPVGADTLLHVGCISKKRYVRIKIVCSGGTCTISFAKVSGILADGDAPYVKESSVVADADTDGNPPLRS